MRNVVSDNTGLRRTTLITTRFSKEDMMGSPDAGD
jgi:hypothetical protein